MAKTPNAPAVAPNVDPAEHQPAPPVAEPTLTPAPEPSPAEAPPTVEPIPAEGVVKEGSAAFVAPDAEKVKVKTTGNFNLMDPFTGATIDANSDGQEVIKSQFIVDKLASKELEEA